MYLESVRKVSFGIAQLSQHQPDRRKLDECESVTVEVLEIFGQSSAAVQPGKRPLHDPASWQDLEAFDAVGSFHDFDREPRQFLRQCVAELWPLIAAVGE